MPSLPYPSLKSLRLLSFTFLLSIGHLHAAQQPIVLTYRLRTNSPITLTINILTPEIVHVQAYPKGRLPTHKSLIVTSTISAAGQYTLYDKPSQITITTTHLIVSVNKGNGDITYFDRKHHLILTENGRSIATATVCGENVLTVRQNFKFRPDEKIFGLGQHQQGQYDYRGKRVELRQDNTDVAVPFFISTAGYGILWDNYSHTYFDDSETGSYMWSEVADAIDYYFIYGPSPDAIIAGNRLLTGAVPLYPRYAFGYVFSKDRYRSAAEILRAAAKFRRLRIPLDVIVQDFRYWPADVWGLKAFDKSRFPNPRQMIAELHNKYHLKYMLSIWPSYSLNTAEGREMYDRGFLYTHYASFNPKGRAIYDAFNPAARAEYWHQLLNLFNLGVDAWWCDATEPEVRGSHFSARTYKEVMNNALGSGARYMNAYSLEDVKGIYQAQRKTTQLKRVVILTRSAFAGQQRYATTTWSGDISASWPTFRRQIKAGLNFCASGLPYWTSDIGGFFVRPSARRGVTAGYEKGPKDPAYKELFTRWYQFGAFCTMFREHGTDFDRENWNFGGPGDWCYDALLKMNYLRYRLLPYIYSVAWMVTSKGYTMMRPLFFDFRNDDKACAIWDEYMFGPSILVCPVTKAGVRSRLVYLPHGCDWYDFWTGKRYRGGVWIQARAPIDIIPLFVRAGSIIPMGPVMQYSSEMPENPIEVRIYGGASGEFTLYDDEGDNYNYEKGAYSEIPIQVDNQKKLVRFGLRQNRFKGMLKERTFDIVIVSEGHGIGLDAVRRPDFVLQYTGDCAQEPLVRSSAP